MSKEELQRKYIELKILEQQSSQLQQQLIMLDNQLQILERTKESIEDVKSVKQDTQAFIPIGQGVFLKGKIEDSKNLLIGVGANIAVTKSAEESKKIIDKQLVEVKNIILQLEQQLQQSSIHAAILDEEMQHLAMKEQENKQ